MMPKTFGHCLGYGRVSYQDGDLNILRLFLVLNLVRLYTIILKFIQDVFVAEY
jgi:hypothetical protein